MKVKELIEILSKLDQEQEVKGTYEGIITEINSVAVEPLDFREPNGEKAVLIDVDYIAN